MAHPVQHIKIYGERNTGTHFVADLLAKNFAIPMFPETPEKIRSPDGRRIGLRIVRAREKLVATLRRHDRMLRLLTLDRFAEITNRKHLPATLGWKHMAPPVEYLSSVPEIAAKTLFIVLVKHPVYWVQSFQKHPYHSYIAVHRMQFGAYVRHIFVPMFRDNVEGPLYDSIVDFYAAKIDGYRRLTEAGFPVELVRYEELIGDISGFLQRLGDKYDLDRVTAEERVREANMKKGEENTLTDFRSKYRLDKVADAVSPEDYEFIMSRFGAERLAWLGYPPA